MLCHEKVLYNCYTVLWFMTILQNKFNVCYELFWENNLRKLSRFFLGYPGCKKQLLYGVRQHCIWFRLFISDLKSSFVDHCGHRVDQNNALNSIQLKIDTWQEARSRWIVVIYLGVIKEPETDRTVAWLLTLYTASVVFVNGSGCCCFNLLSE